MSSNDNDRITKPEILLSVKEKNKMYPTQQAAMQVIRI
jgi:hypothetical protein